MSHAYQPGRRRWLALFALLPALAARAQLGGDQSTVQYDAQAFRTVAQAQTVDGLLRHELRAGRVTIHEYVGASGLVYAVAFSGGTTPNLDQLLGGFASTFTANVQRDARSARVDTATLKGLLHGQPGGVSGVIWLPGLVPPTVNAETLQ